MVYYLLFWGGGLGYMALAVVGNCIERGWALGDEKRMGAGGNDSAAGGCTILTND